MHRSRAPLRLGMPHTQGRGANEAALFAFAAHCRWEDIGALTGVKPASQKDEDGHAVYASIYYAELDGTAADGLGALHPDDDLDVVSTLARHGRNILDGTHAFHAAGTLPATLPDVLPPAPTIRLSNVFVREGRGADDLRITSPTEVERIPPLPAEPDSYQRIRTARAVGRLLDVPADATPLWEGRHGVPVTIDPDRDVNGVGLIYFVSFIAYADHAERQALQRLGHLEPEALDDRRTLRRRVGFYGNARRHDRLRVEVEAFRLAGDVPRLQIHHRIHRGADDRLIAVSSVEKRLRA